MMQQAQLLIGVGKHEESLDIFDNVLETKRNMAIRSQADVIEAEEGIINGILGKTNSLSIFFSLSSLGMSHPSPHEV